MDKLRDDLDTDIDSSMDREATSREMFLLEEGLDLLARYRAIGDPQARHAVRRLVAIVAEGQPRSH